jgi:hypothetical protein
MKVFFIFFILIQIAQNAQAQLHDNTWMLGYSNNFDTTDIFGIVEMKFTNGNMSMRQNNIIDIAFEATNTSFSDSLGNLMYLSNGRHIFGGNDSLMQGGDAIMDGYENGSVWPQYVVGVPWPEKKDSHIVLYLEYTEMFPLDIYCTGLYYAEIDMKQNNGLGQVISRRNIVLEDTLRIGHLVPIRHANGRDWWLLVNELETNRYYRLLITPTGVQINGSQTIGADIHNGVGQSVYSPNGQYYVSFNSVSQQVGNYLDIYNFDRCTGLLSNHIQVHDVVNWGGVAISPNSRYLYQNLTSKAFQYDLQAADILGSKILVAEWDSTYAPFATTFFYMKLAPDGKIYSAMVCGCNAMHVIHNPDALGTDCQYEQHGIQLPTYNAYSIPNHPNYRLGPLDNSLGDTLGINNYPIAWYRYEQDTINPNHITFHNLSYHEPTTWLWEFGDGNSSTEWHPSHVYAFPNVYEACLTVSNMNGTHTHCKTIYGVTASQNPVLQAEVQVTPNPFSGYISVALGVHLKSPFLHLYDISGKLVSKKPLHYGISEINTAQLAKGIYFWQVISAGDVIKIGKAIKI